MGHTTNQSRCFSLFSPSPPLLWLLPSSLQASQLLPAPTIPTVTPPQASLLFLMFQGLLMLSVPRSRLSGATLLPLLVSLVSRPMLLLRLLFSKPAVEDSLLTLLLRLLCSSSKVVPLLTSTLESSPHFQAEQAVRAAEQNLIVTGLQG